MISPVRIGSRHVLRVCVLTHTLVSVVVGRCYLAQQAWILSISWKNCLGRLGVNALRPREDWHLAILSPCSDYGMDGDLVVAD